jgi:UDP-2-acetamido-2,6-beta-L-arabino-hexul-4-ose reductase
MDKSLKKIGITGAGGFVGTHLANFLQLFPEKYKLVSFERSWFDDEQILDSFVLQCDVIVHLAALNRHNQAEVIYRTNTGLVNQLVAAMERTGCKPHVLISSSTQEEHDNLYGHSKRAGREQLANWAKICGAIFTGMIIPNVFGPFGHPFYNSVIATFCRQIAHNETPTIDVDVEMKLIYVGDLVQEIVKSIDIGLNESAYHVPHKELIKVSTLLSQIQHFRRLYQDKGEIPVLITAFDYQLFNTYRCYMDLAAYFPRKYNQQPDYRGAFTEIIRVGIGGQSSYSITIPGITRGNHFHTRKIERFAVIKGKALIQLRRIGTNEVYDFYLNGNEPAYVDMPIWFTHNIKNIGEDLLYTIFWINEPYDANDPDTYFEVV